jgi:hypothetical protein
MTGTGCGQSNHVTFVLSEQTVASAPLPAGHGKWAGHFQNPSHAGIPEQALLAAGQRSRVAFIQVRISLLATPLIDSRRSSSHKIRKLGLASSGDIQRRSCPTACLRRDKQHPKLTAEEATAINQTVSSMSVTLALLIEVVAHAHEDLELDIHFSPAKSTKLSKYDFSIYRSILSNSSCSAPSSPQICLR